MTTSTQYIGRVGALAVALGVGAAALTSPAAWAEPEADTSDSASASDPAGTSDSAPAAVSADTTPDAATPAHDDAPDGAPRADRLDTATASSPSATTTEVAPGVVVSSSGGATKAVTAKKSKAVNTATAAASPGTVRVSAQTATGAQAASPAAAVSTPKPPTPPSVQAITAPVVSAIASVVHTATVIATAPVTAVAQAVNAFAAALLGTGRSGPVESPTAWMLTAAARRELDAPVVADTATATAATANAATARTAAATTTNQPPAVGAPSFGTADPTTGAITGQVIATDPELKKLSYTLTSAPSTGTAVVNKTTGVFTYTPTAAQRVAAGLSPEADTVQFGVTVSDGTNKVATVVDVPVSPITIQSLDSVAVASQPTAIAATDRRAYLANASTNSLTVVDTLSGAVITTIPVGADPSAVVVKPDGSKVYVANAGDNSLTVIDAKTNTVKTTVALSFTPSALAMSAKGTTVYIGNATGNVVKFSTSTDKGVSKVANTTAASSILVAPNGSKIYVTTATGITVFSSSSSTAKSIAVAGDSPRLLAVSRDSSKVYVLTALNTVRVVETSKYTTVGTFTLDDAVFGAGNDAAGAAVNKDGSLLLVTAQDGTLSVLDAKTYDTLTTLDTGSSAAGFATSADGMQAYVADHAGGAMRVVTLVPINTRPVVTAPNATANVVTGVVMGSTGVTDPDADTLTVTVLSKPTKGTVTFTADGGFTYTPTATARHAAAADTAPQDAKSDTFTISLDDGRRGIVQQTVTVVVTPANTVPTYKVAKGSPSSSTGVITGSVTGSDKDHDKIYYDGTITTSKGTAVVTSTGKFTYTPTVSARHAAAAIDAPAADKTDTFTVTVDDGHGGIVDVPVTVTIRPRNTALSAVSATDQVTSQATGRVTGRIAAVDADGDVITYSTPASTAKGTVTVNGDGTYSYTPTATARAAAGTASSSSTLRTDSFTVAISDGHGGTATVKVNVVVVGSTPGNQLPVVAAAPYTVSTDPGTGVVTGAVAVTDASPLTYTLGSTVESATGTVVITSSTGAFTFTPTTRARYHAWFTPGPDTITFTVNASDGQDAVPVDVVAPITAIHPDADGILTLAELKDLVATGDVGASKNAGGTVRAIDGTFTSASVTDTDDAVQALNAVAALLGAPPGFAVAANLTSLSTSTGTVYRLRQTVSGITVLGSEVTLAVDPDGRVTGLISNYDGRIASVNTTASASMDQASEATAVVRNDVLSYLGGSPDSSTSSAFLDSLSYDTELVIYDLDANRAPRLAWRVDVASPPPSDTVGDQLGQGYPSVGARYYIYANGSGAGTIFSNFAYAQEAVATPLRASGTDLLKQSRTFSGANTGTTLVLSDIGRNITTYVTAYTDATWDAAIVPGRIVTSTGTWDRSAVSAQANMIRVYDYYSTVLSRDSFDGQHGAIVISLDYNPSGQDAAAWNNGAWDGTEFLFGAAGNNEAALDLVAHEYTHAVIQHINGLAYLGESGALNESYADILGALIENKSGSSRWLFAEDATGDPYRSMADPSKYGQPELYANRYVDPCGCNANDDHDGVHTNSGIFSYAAYQMMAATTNQVSGDQWAKVFYDSLYRLPATASMSDARYAVLSSARAQGFTPSQLAAITAAFDAVGISAQTLA